MGYTPTSPFSLPGIPRRGYDPTLARAERVDIGRKGRTLGGGVSNGILANLMSRGLGKSAGVYNAPRVGAQVQSDFLSNALNQQTGQEQNFTENARQFDTQTQLALKQLMFQDKWNKQNQPGWLDILGALIGGGATIGAAAL